MNCRYCNKELSADEEDEGIHKKCKNLEMDDLASNILFSPFSPDL